MVPIAEKKCWSIMGVVVIVMKIDDDERTERTAVWVIDFRQPQEAGCCVTELLRKQSGSEI